MTTIRNGALLNVDSFSGILYSNLISTSIKNTIFEDSLLNNMYSFNKIYEMSEEILAMISALIKKLDNE